MIRYFKVRARQTTNDKKFTKDKVYLAKVSGMKEVIIYNNDSNGIPMSVPSKCGFGKRYKYYTDNFDKVTDSDSLAFNKAELRQVLKEMYI